MAPRGAFFSLSITYGYHHCRGAWYSTVRDSVSSCVKKAVYFWYLQMIFTIQVTTGAYAAASFTKKKKNSEPDKLNLVPSYVERESGNCGVPLRPTQEAARALSIYRLQ